MLNVEEEASEILRMLNVTDDDQRKHIVDTILRDSLGRLMDKIKRCKAELKRTFPNVGTAVINEALVRSELREFENFAPAKAEVAMLMQNGNNTETVEDEEDEEEFEEEEEFGGEEEFEVEEEFEEDEGDEE